MIRSRTVYVAHVRKFAYVPVKTYAGSRVWLRHYVKADTIVIRYTENKFPVSNNHIRIFTESDWTLELLKK